MNTDNRGFVDILLRIVVVQIVAVIAVVSAVVITLGRAESSDTQTSAAETGLWQAGYSERFPGCVATVLWPADQEPRDYLVRGRSGSMFRVSAVAMNAGELATPRRAGQTVIGVCR